MSRLPSSGSCGPRDGKLTGAIFGGRFIDIVESDNSRKYTRYCETYLRVFINLVSNFEYSFLRSVFVILNCAGFKVWVTPTADL